MAYKLNVSNFLKRYCWSHPWPLKCLVFRLISFKNYLYIIWVASSNIIDMKISEIKNHNIVFRFRYDPFTYMALWQWSGKVGRSDDPFTRQGSSTSCQEKWRISLVTNIDKHFVECWLTWILFIPYTVVHLYIVLQYH